MDDKQVKTSTFSDAAEGKAFSSAVQDRIIQNHKVINLLDLYAAEEVEFIVDANGEKVWINIDGKCAVRVGKVKHIKVEGYVGRPADDR